MNEDTATTQAVETAETVLTGAEPTTTAQTQGNGQASATGNAPTENPEEARLRAELEKVRKEAASYRVKAKQLEDSQKTEEERRAARLQELEEETTRLKAEVIAKSAHAAITAVAVKFGVKPDLAVRLIAPSEIKFDDNGNATNAESLLKGLIQSAPELVGGGSNAANPARNDPAKEAADKKAWLDELSGNKGFNPFGDTDRAKQKGGGLKFPAGWDGSEW